MSRPSDTFEVGQAYSVRIASSQILVHIEPANPISAFVRVPSPLRAFVAIPSSLSSKLHHFPQFITNSKNILIPTPSAPSVKSYRSLCSDGYPLASIGSTPTRKKHPGTFSK